MKSKKLKKIIAVAIAGTMVSAIAPVAASAAWLKDSQNSWSWMENNSRATGWKQVDGTWYYFDSNGKMKTGWVQTADYKWYYMNSDGAMKTGWLQTGDGKWYNLAPSGEMRTGWVKDTDGKWYFTDTSGAMQTGVVEVQGKVYVLEASGAMATGSTVIGGQTYAIDASGAIAGDKLPIPNKAFTKDGAVTIPNTALPANTTVTTTNSSSSSSSSSNSSSSNNSSNNNTTNSNTLADLSDGNTHTRNYKIATTGTFGAINSSKVTKINGNISIADAEASRRDSIVLQNLAINGTLTVDFGAGNVILNNVTVNGVNVSNVGPNSFHVAGNSSIKNLKVNDENNDAHIVIEGNASIENTTVLAGAKLEVGADATKAAPFANVTISPVAAPSVSNTVTLTGDFNNIIVENSSNVVVAAGSTLQTISANSNLTVSGEGTINNVAVNSARANLNLQTALIGTVLVNEAAAGAQINIPVGTTVTTLNVNAPISVKGAGTIATANLGASETTIETRPANVAVLPNVTATVGGQITNSSNATVIQSIPTDLTPAVDKVFYYNVKLDSTHKVITFTFNKNIINNTADLTQLKKLITISTVAGEETYDSLGQNDTVRISGDKLIITFDQALPVGDNWIFVDIKENALKDEAGNVWGANNGRTWDLNPNSNVYHSLSINIDGIEATYDYDNLRAYNVVLADGTDLSKITASDIVAKVGYTDIKSTVGVPVTNDNGKTWTVDVTVEGGPRITYTINVTTEENNQSPVVDSDILTQYYDTKTPGDVTLTWNKATDDTTPQNELKYYLYMKENKYYNTIDEWEINATLLTQGNDINSYEVTGLKDTSEYYFKLIVEDTNGNKTSYTTEHRHLIVADKAILINAIEEAKQNVNNVVVGTDLGNFAQTDVDDYKAAIALAETVANDTSATQDDIDNAYEALQQAEEKFYYAAITGVISNTESVSENANFDQIIQVEIVGTGDFVQDLNAGNIKLGGDFAGLTIKSVTLDASGDYKANVELAGDLRRSTGIGTITIDGAGWNGPTSGSDITCSVGVTTSAAVDKTVLIDAIAAATTNSTSVEVSTDGSDVLPANKWVNATDEKTYTDAIATAQTVVDRTDTTQNEVQDAVGALGTATDAFNNAKKDGTKVVAGVEKFFYYNVELDSTHKVITFTFNKNIINNTADLTELKKLITISTVAGEETYNDLGQNDTVTISGDKLVITFDQALPVGDNAIFIDIQENALKDEAGNVWLANNGRTWDLNPNSDVYHSLSINIDGIEAINDYDNLRAYNVVLADGTDLSKLTASDIVAKVGNTDIKSTVGVPVTNDNGKTWTVDVTVEGGPTITYTINVIVAATTTSVDFMPNYMAGFTANRNQVTFNVSGTLTEPIDTSKLKYITSELGGNAINLGSEYSKVDFTTAPSEGQYFYLNDGDDTIVYIMLTDNDADAIKSLIGYGNDSTYVGPNTDRLVAENNWYPGANDGAKAISISNHINVTNSSGNTITSYHIFDKNAVEIGSASLNITDYQGDGILVNSQTKYIVFTKGQQYTPNVNPTSGYMKIIEVNEDTTLGNSEWIELDNSGWIEINEANFGPAAIVKATLIDAIAVATKNSTSVVVSTDGSDVLPANKWVNATDEKTYTDAIATAQAVVDSTDTTQTEVQNAVELLGTATNAFNNAKKDGTKAVSGVEEFFYYNVELDSTHKVITFTFNKNIINNTADLTELKKLITISTVAGEETYDDLGENDTVRISGDKLIITFDQSLPVGDNWIFVDITKSALKDEAGNVWGTSDIYNKFHERTSNLNPNTDIYHYLNITVDGIDATYDYENYKIYNVYLAEGTDLIGLSASDIIITAGSSDNDATISKPVTIDDGKTWTVDVTAPDGPKITYTINMKVGEVNKSYLIREISTATENKDTTVVSTDGSEVPQTDLWVSQDDMEAYADAITSAQLVVDNIYATETEVQDALDALQAATETFSKAMKFGTEVNI